MALDPTARLANFRDSVKKYLVDNIKTAEKIPLTFDKGIATPNTRNKDLKRWVAVQWGSVNFDALSTGIVDVYCCTRKDNEGFSLAQLHDTVMGYLTDSSGTDGARRIVFYRSRLVGAWTNIGGLVVESIIESDQLEAEDETKFIILTCTLKFASVV